MSEIEVDKREMTVERLKVVRAQLHATGATVLSPTTEWTELPQGDAGAATEVEVIPAGARAAGCFAASRPDCAGGEERQAVPRSIPPAPTSS